MFTPVANQMNVNDIQLNKIYMVSPYAYDRVVHVRDMRYEVLVQPFEDGHRPFHTDRHTNGGSGPGYRCVVLQSDWKVETEVCYSNEFIREATQAEQKLFLLKTKIL